ncbi:MAG: acylphosphatase [Thermodesulfovibrionia bacterium]
MKKVRVKVRVNGIVQGVFFRASTRDVARRLGLTGWVRNIPDGSVEAVFEGDRDKVEEAIRWCHKGPPGARVTDVDEEWLEYRGEFSDFDIRYGF